MSVPVARPDIVRRADELASLVAASSEEIESKGRLPDELVDAMTDAGLYQLFRAASLGGPEVDPVSAFLAIEALARADGSVGWCAHVSSANAYQLATLAPETVAAMDAAGPGARRFSGSNRPLGRARPVEGGYVVDGRWDFASNCLHADWYCGACISEEDGRQRVRGVFVPMAEAEVIETWQVAGLRGTGSHDVAIREVFVPREHVAAGRNLAANALGRPLYTQRLTMVVNWVLTAAVSLGIAQGALDTFTGISVQGTAHGVDSPLRERSEIQGTVGRATAMLGAARSYCLHAVADVWAAAGAPEETDGAEGGEQAEAARREQLDRLVPEARLAIPYAMHVAVEVVDLLFHAGGTRSIYTRQGLERRFRDAHVAVQHFAGSPSHFAAGGRLAMGLPAAAPFW